MSGIAGRVITFFIVMLGWVFFRADSLLDAFKIFSIMFGKQKLEGFQYYTFGYFIYPKIIVVSIFAFIVSFIPFYKLRERLNTGCVKGIVAIGVLIVSLAFISDASFTPFIYFQF